MIKTGFTSNENLLNFLFIMLLTLATAQAQKLDSPKKKASDFLRVKKEVQAVEETLNLRQNNILDLLRKNLLSRMGLILAATQ